MSTITDILDAAMAAPPYDPANDVRPPDYSDDDLALRFTEKHACDLRYVATWGKWLEWTGAKWQPEETFKAYDLIRLSNREAADGLSEKQIKVATAITSAGAVAAVEKLARADRRHARRVEVWDRDPNLLNTPAGVIDLLTDERRSHHPDLHLTKITAVAPNGDCPRWRQFLLEITGGDAELVYYLQRVCGYMLTGDTREHAFFFAYGTGGNGKGTFINTIAAVMGDYAVAAPMETFTVSNGERHPTELAMLRGARMVSAQETEEAKRLNEARIKTLTGGDAVSARFMRQDFFTYIPQFKLFLAGNHKPILRNVDEAMRRRIHLIPFTVTIPAEQRDPGLADALKHEWSGILAWMIEGAAIWRDIGLSPPAIVTEATAAYLLQQDSLSQWIEERCEVARNVWDSNATLYNSWCDWCEHNGEQAGPQKTFSQKLFDRGFEPARSKAARMVRGLRMVPREPAQPHWTEDNVQ
jgi:P4 family phage/plasmid primase-like protien